MIQVCVMGARGRMGQLIARYVCVSKTMNLSAAVVRADDPYLGQCVDGCPLQDLSYQKERTVAFAQSDVVIDFTSSDAFEETLDKVIETKTPYVCGTTGLTLDQKKKLADASKVIPLVYASNTSVGVTLLTEIVEELSRKLGPEFDIEIGEFHHRHKKDAPSGTSLLLGEAAARGRSLNPRVDFKTGDRTGERAPNDIGFAVMRGGGIAGDHQVVFASEDEVLILSHRALSRDMFAKGALRAASWIIHQKPGFYSMRDVLDLNIEHER